jgi:hypothetical protein
MNAVQNAVPLGPIRVAIIDECGPQAELKEVRVFLDRAKRPPCKLRQITTAGSRRGLLPWLLQQVTAGAFAVEFRLSGGLHVVTWVAASDGAATILETDPEYPDPILATAEALEDLGITASAVQTVCEILPAKWRRKPS